MIFCNEYRLNGRAVSDWPKCIEIFISIHFTANSIYVLRMNKKKDSVCLFASRDKISFRVTDSYLSFIRDANTFLS